MKNRIGECFDCSDSLRKIVRKNYRLIHPSSCFMSTDAYNDLSQKAKLSDPPDILIYDGRCVLCTGWERTFVHISMFVPKNLKAAKELDCSSPV